MLRLHRPFRVLLGLALWTGAVVWIAGLLAAPRGAASRSTADDLGAWLGSEPATWELRFPRPAWVRVGDPVHRATEGGAAPDPLTARPIGEVEALLDEKGHVVPHTGARVRSARVRLYDVASAPRRGAAARLLYVPELATGWVLRTLIPPETMGRVVDLWQRAWRRDGPAIIRELAPHARELLDTAGEVAAAEARPFLLRHREEVDRVLRRAEVAVGREDLKEVFETTVWPLLREHFEPVAERLGRELWDRLPLWSLSWRLAWQSLPLTADDWFDARWERFVDEELVPAVRAHLPHFLRASRTLAREALAEPRLARFGHRVLLRLADDPAFHRLAAVWVREVFLENPDFRERVERWWRTPRVRAAVDRASDRLEVTVRRTGELLLGTRATGISPELARVLRAQILRKERRRVVLESGPAGAAPIPPGGRIPCALGLERGETSR